MKNLIFFFSILIIFILNGCTTGSLQYRFVPPAEGSYAFTKASGVGSVSESEVDIKTGKSTSFSVLGLVSLGSSGNGTAARNGGIDIIKTSQMDVLKIKLFGLPIYTEYTTTVTGK
jgi:hypothetical protein